MAAGGHGRGFGRRESYRDGEEGERERKVGRWVVGGQKKLRGLNLMGKIRGEGVRTPQNNSKKLTLIVDPILV